MSRQERRRQERLLKQQDEKIDNMENKRGQEYERESRWIKNLKPWQNECVKKTIAAATKFAHQEGKLDGELDAIACMDKILTGTLLEKTDMTWEETAEFNKKIGEYYQEYRFIESKIGKEERLKMLNGLETEITALVEEMIITGKTKGQVVKVIREKYKDACVTTPEAHNVYMRCLDTYKKYVVELQDEIIGIIEDFKKKGECKEGIINLLKIEYPRIAEKDLEGIYGLAEAKKAVEEAPKTSKKKKKNKKATAKEVKEEITEEVKAVVEPVSYTLNEDTEEPEKIDEVIEEATITVEPKEIIEKEDRVMSLKVVKEVVKVVSRELQGEFGKYVVDETGVTRNGKLFKDVEAVEEYKKKKLERLERQIAEIKAVFDFAE